MSVAAPKVGSRVRGLDRRPRLGFLGVGWIGRHRLAAVAESGAADVCAIADPAADALREARAAAPQARVVADLEALLAMDIDGLVIATPSALHADQCVEALGRGVPVFCQKPLARTAAEAQRVVDAARAADRLLGVDLSYRHLRGVPDIRALVASGELGQIYAADLTFHNAYGPDKPWFYDLEQCGGGAVMDLGVHLVDLALWILDQPPVTDVASRLLAEGEWLSLPADRVEDFAMATLETQPTRTCPAGASVRLMCSWNVHAGQDAVIEARFYGTQGGATLRNVDGSFYDFLIERTHGTARHVLSEPPDAWGGRAIVAWAARLAHDPSFDESASDYVRLHDVLDRIYGRSPAGQEFAPAYESARSPAGVRR